MSAQLHIHIHPDALESPEIILADFPFDKGQSMISFSGGVLVIDLGGEEDSNYVQDWYLNSHDAVQSFYVVED